MAQIPVAIRVRPEFLNQVLSQFEHVEMTRDTITGFPSVPIGGLRVITDDSLTEDYKVEYKEGPSIEDIKKAFETLNAASLI